MVLARGSRAEGFDKLNRAHYSALTSSEIAPEGISAKFRQDDYKIASIASTACIMRSSSVPLIST